MSNILSKLFSDLGYLGTAIVGDSENPNMLQRIGAGLESDADKQRREQQTALKQMAQQQFGNDPALMTLAQTNPDVFASILAKKYALEMENKYKTATPQSALAKLSADYAAGLIPKEAYDAAIAKETAPTKEQKEEADQMKGRQSLDESLARVQEAYDKLDKSEGIPSTKRNALSNLLSSVKAAEPITIFGNELPLPAGQSLGKGIASEDQAQRDFIKNARTLILQDIKNATGMSSQQINSNAELKTFLDSLGDPRQSIETVKETLANISEKFGTGALSRGESVRPLGKRIVRFGDLP